MLTADQITQLAPDAASLKAGREQARPAAWQGAGTSGLLLWGAVQGSGKLPYQTVVDFGAPAFHCTCPSRKFPCKHALGLLLVAEQGAIQPAEPPPWAAEWQAKRAESSDKKAAKAEAKAVAADDPEAQAKAAASAEKRSAKREQSITAGLEQTRLWLDDLIQQGLAWAQTQPSSFWTAQIARLTDAQAPGAARQVEDCAAVCHSGNGWPARLLPRLARLHLLCRAWVARTDFEAAHLADLHAAIGLTVAQEDVLATGGLSGSWQVLARVAEERGALKSLRHWLIHLQSSRLAQVFHYAIGAQPLDTSLMPGAVFDGELVFYPGRTPRRALVKQRGEMQESLRALPLGSAQGLAESWGQVGEAWALNPFVPQQGMLFQAVPRADLGGFVDATGLFMPWPAHFVDGWVLTASAGGEPVLVFGETDGVQLMPLLVTLPQGREAWRGVQGMGSA